MFSFLMILLPSAWFLAMAVILSTLLFRLVNEILTDPPSPVSPYRAIPLVVGLGYLAFVALIAQDCFFPNKTASIFKIHSAGPDKEIKWVDTRVPTKSRIQL